jgi:phosphatidylglycerol:prolipoprotein diacylglycerol transferase
MVRCKARQPGRVPSKLIIQINVSQFVASRQRFPNAGLSNETAQAALPLCLPHRLIYGQAKPPGNALIHLLASAGAPLDWSALHLSPIALDLGILKIRWYSLAYIAGILIGWWYMLKLLAQPGAPMARRHADDLVFYATLGILIGGRLAYVIFYRPEIWQHPVDVLKLWEGGMSFHGGAFGVLVAILYLARKNGLSALRIHDYVSCCAPFGLFFGRLANFVNGELWGRPTTLPWGMIFPRAPDTLPRHPSQLYEAGLEGLLLCAVLAFFFWRTDGAIRFGLEYVRQPDAGLEHLSWGLTMGQTLSLPMVLVGIYFIVTAKGRRVRVEPFAGGSSVA